MLAHETSFWWAPQSLGRKGYVRVCAWSSAKPVLMKPPPRRAAWHGCNTTLTFSVARDSTWDSSMIFAPCCLKFLLSLFWLHQSYFALTLGLIWREPVNLSVFLLLSPWSVPKGALQALGKEAMSSCHRPSPVHGLNRDSTNHHPWPPNPSTPLNLGASSWHWKMQFSTHPLI